MRQLTQAFRAVRAASPENVQATHVQHHWRPRPALAATLRAVAFCGPILLSAALVYLAAWVVPPPRGSLGLYVGWWAALSGGATVVLALAGRLSRRLVPLAALMRLSLVFPDGAPSRFAVALHSGTVATLEERLVDARRGAAARTPIEAAQLLLELVALLDTHDGLTRGHSERVRAYAQSIGKELRLDRDALDLLNWAALLHDVGKLEVPAEVLSKTGRPTEREWEVLERHPAAGAELAAPMREWLGEWFRAISEHHERWDGGGYPRGLAGTEISLAARIVAVADVYDVVTSSRSYQDARSTEAARRELANCAGRQFDPDVVRAFLELSLRPRRILSRPLAWVAHAAVLVRIPLTPAVGAVSAAAVVLGTGMAVTPNVAARGPIAVEGAAPAPQVSAALSAARDATQRRAGVTRARPARNSVAHRVAAVRTPLETADLAGEPSAVPVAPLDASGTVTAAAVPSPSGPPTPSDAPQQGDQPSAAGTTPATDPQVATDPVASTVGTVVKTVDDTVSRVESSLGLPPAKTTLLPPVTLPTGVALGTADGP